MESKSVDMTGGVLTAMLVVAANNWQMIVTVFVMYLIVLAGNLGTGLMYAQQQKNYSEEVARQAFWRKFGMISGIMVLAVVDIFIMSFSMNAGVNYNLPVFTIALAGYSATHELLSMIANLKKLGNKVPSAVEGALNKAEKAFDQGKLPDVTTLMKGDKE